MSVTSSSTSGTAAGRLARRWRPSGPAGWLLAGLAVLAIGTGVLVVVTDPFASGNTASGGIDNAAATSLATVTRRSLSSQTQVSGTLGYADSSTIVVPAGTAPSAVHQAEQSFAAAEAALRAAQSTLATDTQALERARAKLAADRLKQSSDCRGANAATNSSPSSDSNSSSGSSPCSSAAQAVVSDKQDVISAEQKVATDKGSVASAQVTLSGAQQSLAATESSAVVYDAGATYTMLPSPGDVIRRGRPLYAISGQPVLLLYGRVTAWRAFRPGMSDGRDVAELNANLRALGYGSDLAGDNFTAATASAIRALEAAHGLAQTGELPLGSVMFTQGPVRVKSVTPAVGQAVQAGPVLSVTSTSRQVTIDLEASQQAEVKVGDPVTITLPSNRTTPGRVSYVGRVATTPSDSGADSSSAPTVEVDVTPTDPSATGRLDQAPVQVSIITASVKSALVVPVDALLALSGGGYAVETVDAAGAHHLLPVTLGLFDDADGLVQVSGAGLHDGQRVVVPGS